MEDSDDEGTKVAAYLKRKRDAPSNYCKHTNCKKQRQIQGYCQVHAKEVLGEDVVPDSRTVVTQYCKFSGCSKWRVLKCFCLEHAREEDQEVVEEHLSKQRERYAKRKRGDDDGDNDS